MTVALWAGVACLLLVWRLWVVIPGRWRQKPARQRVSSPEETVDKSTTGKTVSTLVVLGSGECYIFYLCVLC